MIAFFSSLSFIVSAFAQLERLELFQGKVNIYLFEVPLFFCLLLLILHYKRKPFESIKVGNVGNATRSLLIYMSIIFIGTVFFYSGWQNVIAFLYLIRLSVYILFILYFLYYCSHVKKAPRSVLVAFIVFLIILIGSAIAQYCYYPDLRNLFYAGWDPHYYRLFGLYFEPVMAAAVYGVCVLYLLTTKLVSRALRIPGAIIVSGFLIASYSRAAWIAFGITLLFFMARNKYLKYACMGMLIIAFVFILLPKPSGEGVNIWRTSTIFSRSADYSEGISIWSHSPVFGVGYNHIPSAKHSNQPNKAIPDHAAGSLHSSFLIMLATGGIIGVLLFLNWVCSLYKLSSFLQYAIIFIGITSLFDNVLLHPFVLLLIGVLGGVSLIRLSDT